ncbi:DUF4124 domain-containing protein [Shewanella avicenniae]|uniref:DUF4124 domain-containing protein n=1 Tax=Shewanella avicenniae TaxID=2814294 RepID=A0ABX7QQU8_9GAMM|nr:DUF4124 domain-containing protein [Shewanella avicenniae]QSX33083.1 DUF4124 domain-containing protein [Shewanella avicenniae]
MEGLFIYRLFSISGQFGLLASALLFVIPSASAATVYKCEKQQKVIYSQQPCEADYKEHRVDYKFGVTTITDSDEANKDPIQKLLENRNLSQEEFIKQLEQEIFRLNQQNSYIDLVRDAELKKLERQHFWHKKEEDKIDYQQQVQYLNNYYDEQLRYNNKKLSLLLQHKEQALSNSD